MAYLTIRGNALWVKHIEGDPKLVEHILALPQNASVTLLIDAKPASCTGTQCRNAAARLSALRSLRRRRTRFSPLSTLLSRTVSAGTSSRRCSCSRKPRSFGLLELLPRLAYAGPAVARGRERMDAPRFDKRKLPSRHVTEGPERAPHRSYFYAMGLSEAEIHQPFVGVATCWNEAAPCNIALSRQAQAVKLGVKQALGHAARVHHHHRHRRHRHGPRGHALLARQPRGDRRHRRADHARALLRRARRARRLRQEAARA